MSEYLKSKLRLIPWLLVYSRLATALIFLFFGIFDELYFRNTRLCLFLFCFGFAGDIFDGIIARQLRMDTTLMRRLDSLFDTLFWLTAAYLLYQSGGDTRLVLVRGATSVISVVILEYGVCLIRFRKTPSAHNTLSKLFGLVLFVFFVSGFLQSGSIVFGIFVFSLGVVARLDSLCIYLIVREWTHDVPSFYHAWLIRNGKTFRKNKLLHSEHKQGAERA